MHMTMRGREDLKTYLHSNMSTSPRCKILMNGNKASDTGGDFTAGTLDLLDEIYTDEPVSRDLIDEFYTITAVYTRPGQDSEVAAKALLKDIRDTLHTLTKTDAHPYAYRMRTTRHRDDRGSIEIGLIFEMIKGAVDPTE